MEDVENAASQRQRAGYFQQYLARMAPTPLPPAPLPFPPSSSKLKILTRASNDRKISRNDHKIKFKDKEKTRKSLVDAFKQHGMKLCDGSKLNAVAKGVTSIGVIPPTLGVHITALYLSQNELRSLDGIVQFKGVRLLSLAGNALTRFSDIEQLQQLLQLRHLNLMGNPLCGQPNYRLRVVDTLRQLHLLDTVEISKHEKELAPLVASQDRALREMVMKNHVDIQKLQRLAVWIRVIGDLQCLVLRDAVTGRFDQLPSRHNGVDIEKFLQIWKFEDAMSGAELEVLETQMLAIIARTKMKMLEETPQSKAAEMLLKLANGSVSVSRRWNGKGKEMPHEMQRECSAWEDAYVHVLHLQQQTIANLRGECDRNRRDVVEKQRQLVVMNPHKRQQHCDRQQQSIVPRPQQPKTSIPVEEQKLPARDQAIEAERYQPVARAVPKTERRQGQGNSNQVSHRRILRSGEFGNKTLHEAISSFTLRQPQVVPRVQAPPRPATRLNTTTYVHVNASEAGFEADRQVSDLVAHQEALVKRPISYHHARQNMSTVENFSDVESCGMTATETVFSGDVSSVAGSSVDRTHRDLKYLGNPFVTASNAQHHGQQDLVRKQWIDHAHELRTVAEDDESQQSDRRYDDEDEREDEQGSFNRPFQPHDRAVSPRFLSDRQHELEAREEKYIAALMESEQRELDLRQQISAMHQQLSRFQQLISENDSERRKIKEEITARACSVAKPTLLRRFFIKWIRYNQWALQLRHVEKRRRFIATHDAFWSWRRKVWIQQQLRRIRHRQCLRVVRCHLMEWANLTRISVIAMHTQALRQSHLLQRIVGEWRQYTFVQKHMKAMQADHENASSRELLATSFSEWVKLTRKGKQLQRFQQFYSRESKTSWKRLVLSRWKIFVLSVARPERERATALAIKLQATRKRQHFIAWKRVTKCELLHRVCTRRHVWNVWRGSLQQLRLKREQEISSRNDTLRSHLTAWRGVGSDRLVTRRALSLATRHVNQRRLRKIWMHWKAYSIARKRHMQGASKAFKHYFVKLLRKTWTRWKQEAVANVVSVKQTKKKELQFHFNALCRGVDHMRGDKKRLVFVSHACRRRQIALTRKVFKEWSECTKRRRRCKAIHSILSGQRSKALVGFVWSQWKYQRLVKLKHLLLKSTHHYKSMDAERQETEQELLEVNDRSIALCEQVQQLTQRLEAQQGDIAAYQNELLIRERVVVTLENQLAKAKNQLQQSNEERDRLVNREQADKRVWSESVTQLQDENKVLKKRISEMEVANETMTRRVEAEVEEKKLMEERVHGLTSHNETLRRGLEDQERSLSATIRDLTLQLGDEQRERDDTVKRLQEYEARIASTCAEIGDHEKAHEEERIALRTENVRLESLRMQEAVRNGELQRLLSEKNDQIIALSVRLKGHETEEKGVVTTANVSSPSKEPPQIVSQTKAVGPIGSDRAGEFEEHSRSHDLKRVSQEMQVEYEQERSSSSQTQVHYLIPVVASPTKLEPSEEELQIDARTSRIHADIQLLQERISKRLQQIPCVPAVDEITGRGHHPVKLVVLESDSGSISTISESELEERKPRRRASGVKQSTTTAGVTTTKSAASKGTKRAAGRTSDRESDRENASRAANMPKSAVSTLAPRSHAPSAGVRRSLVRSVVATESIKTKKR